MANTKANFHAIFDADIFNQYVKIVGKGNTRVSLEKYMANVVAASTHNLDMVDLKILNLEIEKLEEKMQKTHSELQKKVQIREEIAQKLKEKTEKELKEMKENIENRVKCANCGGWIDEKRKHTFPIGQICHVCFITADGKQVKMWNEMPKNDQKTQ